MITYRRQGLFERSLIAGIYFFAFYFDQSKHFLNFLVNVFPHIILYSDIKSQFYNIANKHIIWHMPVH